MRNIKITATVMRCKMSLKKINEKEKKMIFTGARLPESLLERIDEFCARTGATKSGVIRVALENFLDKWDEKERGR